MKYFVYNNQRDGTCYHEFYKGKWDGKTFWKDDSICIDDNDFYALNGIYFASDLKLNEYLHQCIVSRDNIIQIRVDKRITEKNVIKAFQNAVSSAGKSINYEQSINSVRNIYTWSIKYNR